MTGLRAVCKPRQALGSTQLPTDNDDSREDESEDQGPDAKAEGTRARGHEAARKRKRGGERVQGQCQQGCGKESEAARILTMQGYSSGG